MINSIVDGTITVVLFLPELNLAQACASVIVNPCGFPFSLH